MNRPTASVWRLAARQVWRDFLAGELRLLLWAVVLAVGALTAVGFFADRMRSGLVRDAAQLLGGDAIVLADKPLAPAFAQEALRRGFAVGQAVNFPSMARAGAARGGAARLAAVKAVDAAGRKITVGTFDVNADVVQNVIDGKLLFAIDQQPYVQGYLGVVGIYLKVINGNDIGGGQPVYSGPAIITKDNAASVLKFAKQGTR